MRPTITALTPEIPDETMLTTGDLAAVLAISRSKASELLATAEIPGAVRVGSKYRVAAGVVRAWLAATALPQNRDIYDLRAALRDASKNKKRATTMVRSRPLVDAHPVKEEQPTWTL